MPKSYNMASKKRCHARARLYKAQNGKCWLCGKQMLNLPRFAGDEKYATIDHIVPASRGGSNNINNLRLAHDKCNHDKQDYVIEAPVIEIPKYASLQEWMLKPKERLK